MRRECRERFSRHRLQRKPPVSDPGMHHGTCVTHVPWCVSGSLTRGGGEKRSRHSRCMRNPQFYVSGKRPMARKPYPQSSYFVTCCKLRPMEYVSNQLAGPRVGVTKPISSVPLFFQTFQHCQVHWLPIEYHVHIWPVSPKLRCGDTRQIRKWFKEYGRPHGAAGKPAEILCGHSAQLFRPYIFRFHLLGEWHGGPCNWGLGLRTAFHHWHHDHRERESSPKDIKIALHPMHG